MHHSVNEYVEFIRRGNDNVKTVFVNDKIVIYKRLVLRIWYKFFMHSGLALSLPVCIVVIFFQLVCSTAIIFSTRFDVKVLQSKKIMTRNSKSNLRRK